MPVIEKRRLWSGAIEISLLALAVTLSTGCGSARVVAFHDPMHPTNSQAVTFRAEATGTVDRVELAYERYTLSTGPGNTKVQTLAQAMTTVKTCDPPGSVSSLTCTHTMPSAFAANSLINFRVRAVDPQNRTSSETYSFASGDYPWPNDPIPIRVKGGTADKLDVVFIPDTDITVANFRSQLDEVIEDLYFKYSNIKFWRGLYNFYYSGQQGNYEELCNFTNPSNMAQLTAIADTVAILHSADLRDCRSGTLMSSEIDYDKTLIHETGHALFNLKDEYCCDSSYSQQGCVPNLYSSLANCQGDATNVGYPSSNCTKLTKGADSVNFWRIDPTTPSPGCIMGPSQHSDSASDFQKACSRRLGWRYGKCLNGQCMTSPECP
jgi:hypothetical protein